jgi:hypothetical protein
MNSYTRHLFYLNRPQFPASVVSFRKNCPENENTIVLGCYHPGQNGIFIYNVQDPTLAGVKQVTAAHEVLHAVYERLSSKERAMLDAELENFYRHGLHNQRVITEVKIYQQTEPGDVMDEMSCTFGTELASLPVPLETYYSHYFKNRSAIVAYEQKYEGEFTSRQAAINHDDALLADLKSSINANTAELSSKRADIDSLQSALLAERNNNPQLYNARVPAYNQLVVDYNAEVDSTRNLIAQYNQLVATRNQVAGQLTTLDKALDTRLTQISTNP